SGSRRKRMEQQAALQRIARSNQLLNKAEILAGLIFCPGSIACLKRFEAQARGQSRVAIVTTRAVLARLQENRFDLSAIGLEIESRFLFSSCLRGRPVLC